jgi:hypothetical protein
LLDAVPHVSPRLPSSFQPIYGPALAEGRWSSTTRTASRRCAPGGPGRRSARRARWPTPADSPNWYRARWRRAYCPLSPSSRRTPCSSAGVHTPSVGGTGVGDASTALHPAAAAGLGAEQRMRSAVPRNVRNERGTAGRGRPVEPGKRDRTAPDAGTSRGTPKRATPGWASAAVQCAGGV